MTIEILQGRFTFPNIPSQGLRVSLDREPLKLNSHGLVGFDTEEGWIESQMVTVEHHGTLRFDLRVQKLKRTGLVEAWIET